MNKSFGKLRIRGHYFALNRSKILFLGSPLVLSLASEVESADLGLQQRLYLAREQQLKQQLMNSKKFKEGLYDVCDEGRKLLLFFFAIFFLKN